MKKIFLILLLCLFSSSVNAGLKEIGNVELEGIGPVCKWTMASRDRATFLTKSGAVVNFLSP